MKIICPNCGRVKLPDGIGHKSPRAPLCYTCGYSEDKLSLEDSHRGFNRMREAAEAVLADPTNRDKIRAARIATDFFRMVHHRVMQDAGLPDEDTSDE